MLKKLVLGLMLVIGLTATAGKAEAYYPYYYGSYYRAYAPATVVTTSYYATPYAGYAYTYAGYGPYYNYNYAVYARPAYYPLRPFYYGPRVSVGVVAPRVGVFVGY